MNKPQRNAPPLKNPLAIFVALLAAYLYMTAAASAAVISVNFTAGGGTTLGSGEVAGFVPDDHWNNSPGNTSATMTNLLDGEGQTVTGGFQVSYANAAGVWRNTSSDPADANASLFNGQLYQHPFNGPITTVTLTNVPYARYDLYVYLTGPASDGRKNSVSITGQPTYYVQVTLNGGFNYTTGGSFVRSTNTTGTSIPQANYVLYENLTTEDLSFAVTEIAGNPGLAGFQIVQVPEPATLTLLAAGLLVALRRRAA